MRLFSRRRHPQPPRLWLVPPEPVVVTAASTPDQRSSRPRPVVVPLRREAPLDPRD